jgi:hypothetical protein
MLVSRPNEVLVSCKRPEITYGPLSPLGVRGRRPGTPAFVGCTSGLSRNPRLTKRLEHFGAEAGEQDFPHA